MSGVLLVCVAALITAQQLHLGSTGASLATTDDDGGTSSVVLTAPGGATLTLRTNAASDVVPCIGPSVVVVDGQCQPKQHTVAAATAGYIQREVELRVDAALANLTSRVSAQLEALRVVQNSLSSHADNISALNAKTAPLDVSSGSLRITQTVTLAETLLLDSPGSKFALCQTCGTTAYSCTRAQAAERCSQAGRRLCTRGEIAAFAEMGGASCCWGWTSTLGCSDGYACSTGYIVFPMQQSISTGHSGGCGGDAGGMRESVAEHTQLSAAHCCSF